MDIKEINGLTEIVIHKYLTECVTCPGLNECDIIKKMMDVTMEIVMQFLMGDSDNSELMVDDLDDFELILGET
ncbi:hypothetical protein LCGC14_2391030 [marine sediment metagenome]|uniref:Uncharacterized protein n=1 Tax=marine sediment metagenome TaxID=412755 RepID=A0A0F9ESQ0_9ZZZZ